MEGLDRVAGLALSCRTLTGAAAAVSLLVAISQLNHCSLTLIKAVVEALRFLF